MLGEVILHKVCIESSVGSVRLHKVCIESSVGRVGVNTSIVRIAYLDDIGRGLTTVD